VHRVRRRRVVLLAWRVLVRSEADEQQAADDQRDHGAWVALHARHVTDET
jgi:hypothetical protein